ncbi:Gfo/Idh/MocA family oxidoreductase [Fulvivirgaceae bacterium PWU5]|uniref:Gfo/Idh/MocA family oxidoreductase n=1 Tax=Dawidia cretensis TaxID=2782350 RepID=A0AAP2GUT8_9BACT|nr:Gfo/Idh/MocA family oxidoreductase [Dawidia cretensis]MBT1709425.1 Gfo/Idh/MocA family oxidoreductase [Dawidia cretensis]
MNSLSRRNFIRQAAMAGAGMTLLPSALLSKEKDPAKVRLGFIGVGLRGQGHLELALHRADVEVVAICDIQQRMIDMSKELIAKSGKPMPQIFSDGPYGYKKLLERKDIDAVIIATPWEWHTVMCLDAMNAKKYVGCEVITGMTVEECWELVHTSERTGMPLMMLENVCYRRDVMAVLNMVRQNVFGEVVHLQGGYQHDLRAVKFNNGKDPYGGGVEFGEKAFSEASWRTQHSVLRDGDLYPTHGLGPVAMMIDINRGNRLTELVSYSSKGRGLHDYIVKNAGENHPNAKVGFKLGDIVTTMIKCARGETILLQHDTNLPRPYSLGFRVQGTNGLWMDVNNSIYVEGKSKPHEWDDAQSWLDKYDHPLWKKYGNDASGAGHGGMDWFVINAFIEAVKRKTNTPQDVYDAVTWSAITPLSETSIRLGGETVEIPDFTQGQWMYRKNEFARNDDY